MEIKGIKFAYTSGKEIMGQLKLFMMLLGCRSKGRYIEQHDIFFGIGKQLKDVIPAIKEFWPEAGGEIHIDAWREINCVDGFAITVEETGIIQNITGNNNKESDLFFINLGGYKEDEFEEFHYKMLVVADNIGAAKSKAKKTAFFKHTSLSNSVNTRSATSHIDDKYGIDADDMYVVKDILPADLKEKYTLRISSNTSCKPDEYHLGYLRLKDLYTNLA